MRNNYKLWITISLVIVFAAGVTGGILLDRNILHQKPQKAPKKRDSIHFPTIETMAKELSLTADQQEKIKTLFEKGEEEFKSLRRDIQGRLSSMRKQLIADIKSVLDEEQTLKFEAMIEKYLTHRKKDMEERKSHSRKENIDK